MIKSKKVKISVKDENGNLIKHRFAEVEVDSKGKTKKLPNGSLAIIRIIKEVPVKKANSSKNDSGLLEGQTVSDGVKSPKKRKNKNLEPVGSPPTRSHTAKLDFANDEKNEKKSYKMTKKSEILRPIPVEKKRKRSKNTIIDEKDEHDSPKVSEFDIDLVSLDTIKSKKKKKFRKI